MAPSIPRDEQGRKHCGKCGEYKDPSEFHKSKRDKDGLKWECKACFKLYRRKHYVENTEAYQAYRESKREEARLYALARYQQKGAEIRRKNKEYRERNPLAKTWKRIWKRKNPDKAKATYHRREARKHGNGGMFTGAEWAELKARYGYRCLCCQRAEPEITLTADHVVPLVSGGSSDISNIQPLCLSCNCSKREKTIDYRP